MRFNQIDMIMESSVPQPTRVDAKVRNKALRSMRYWKRKLPSHIDVLDHVTLNNCAAYATKYKVSVSFIVLGALLQAVNGK